ncbi:MAG: type II toxin-antitoxin system HicB family antitoxin [Burkholderiales bacterium]|nr:type II toxin-antitoxin system HicB family antitoxin [Anaerolineae bacterium]
MRQVLVYTDEDGAWCASCPSLSGCHSQGETREEALANIKETIQLWIDDAIDHGEPIPPDTYEMVSLDIR